MSSVVTSAISYMMAANEDMYQDMYGNTITTSKAEAANDARQNFIDSMQTIFDQLVQDASNIPVVIYVPSGTRLTVFPNEDLWLRSEEDDIAEAGETVTDAQKPNTSSWVDTRSESKEEPAEEEEDVEADEETEEKDEESITSTDNDEKYYKPADKYEQNEKPANNNEPIYKGDSVEKQAIQERKVEPVLPKTGSADRLF
jgi:hypothetical protein